MSTESRGVEADVLIIGAGPAGAIAAAQLNRKGHSVLVIEKQQFPRFSVGESLLAQSLELLHEAGLLEAVMAAGFQFKNGAAFARNGKYTDFNFSQKTCEGYPFSFQVPRAEFDKILADEAERQGAKFSYLEEIVSADFTQDRPLITSRTSDGAVHTYRPRFVLDASGFGRTLSRLLKLERPSKFPARAALFTQVHDHIESGAFDRQKIRITVHPLHQDVWYWLIPFHDGRSSMGVVASDEFLQRYSGSPSERLWAITNEDPGLRALLSKATPFNPVGELRGYACSVDRLWGQGFALLGNAAEFLDPVFSSGVTIAMKSALLATDVLDRQLHGSIVDWDRDYSIPLMLGVETFRGFVDGWYDGSLQEVIFYDRQDVKIRRMICSILAGYAWDESNPYVGSGSGRRLNVLAQTCRRNP